MSSISPGLSTPSSSFVWKNITVDDTDSSLKYSQGWNRSESSAAHGGSFLVADGVGNHVSFSLPANAVSVYYFGFKQSSGAFYDACLDCHTNATVDAIDGHSSDEPHSSEPTLLYHKTNLDPSVHHTLDLVNMADARFEDSSTITVDSFVVTIIEEEPLSSTSTSSVTHSTSASESATMSSMNIVSLMAMDPTNVGVEDSPSQTPTETPSAMSSTTSSQASASGLDRTQNQNNLSSAESSAQKIRSPLLLTGLILAILFVVCTSLYALMYFMRRRKRRRTAPVLGEGHWAARFFGEKGRGSIWIGNVGRLGAGVGAAKVAKRAMVEQLIPDKPLHTSLPSRPNMRASPPPRQTTNQWFAPAYNPYNTSQTAVSTRTIPRSAFPSSSPSTSPPGLPMQNWQVARGRSASVGTNPMYTRAPSRTPSADSTYSQAQRPMMPSEFGDAANPDATNPYVVEARARVRDRARGANDGGLSGPAISQANSYGYGYGNGVDNAYGQPGAPGYGYGYGYGSSGTGMNRDDSWGRRYGP